MTKLSVIIPCYNNGIYLKEMIDCCLKQTFNDWELIIVDDHSTDNQTPQIVREYANKDKRIKFFTRNRNPKGSVVCRNIGFERSSGKYIIHFDADDLISDTCFEKRVKFMEENPDCDYATFIAKAFYVGGSFPPTIKSKGKTFGIKRSGDLLTDFLTTNYSFSVWNNIYRRCAIENYLWDENVCIYTDFSFIIPCILNGMVHKFADSNQIDYYYRTAYTKNNMCASYYSDAKSKSTLYLFSKTLDSLCNRKDYEHRKSEFLLFVVLHFSRLLIANNDVNVAKFIDFSKKYYGKNIANKLQYIFNKCKDCRTDTERIAKVNLFIFFKFGYTDYFWQLLYTLYKKIIK